MKLKCCPLCERPLGQAPALFEKLETLANGKRSYEQLAEMVGSTPKRVAVAIAHMRRRGYDVSGLTKPKEYGGLVYVDHEQMARLRAQGLSYAEIGRRYGKSAPWAYRICRRLAAEFGPMPGRRVTNTKWNPDVMRERIRELREDADLPWKNVAQILDLTPHYVAKLYRELGRVHG